MGTKHGLLKGWYPRTEVGVERKFMTPEDVPKQVTLTLREAASQQSMSGGQGFKKCNCKGGCKTKKYSCFKNNILCNSRCHSNLVCTNKHENDQ